MTPGPADPVPASDASVGANAEKAPGDWSMRRAIGLLTAILCVVYVPIFWGQIIFFRDPAHWNYPARMFVRNTLLAGEFPHWNPYVGLGVPVWGNPLYGLFYPPNWLLLLTPEHLVANMLTWQGFAHLWWGAVGIMFLARRFGCRGAAALIGGLAWGLSGYTTSMWSAGVLLFAGAWVPWMAVGFLAAARAVKEGRPARAPLLAFAPVVMGLLLGEVFIAMMGVGFAALTALAYSRRPIGDGDKGLRPQTVIDGTAGRSWRTIVMVAAAVVCAGLVAAIVYVPGIALLARSPRGSGLQKKEAEAYSVHPIRLIEFIAPGSMGVPHIDYPAEKYAGEPTVDGAPLATSDYLGAVAVGLALLALRRGRRDLLWILAFWIVMLFVSFGRHTPVHSLWRTVILPFSLMRYPEKYVVLLVGWLAILVAVGSERMLAESRRLLHRIFVFVGAHLTIFSLAGLFDPGLARYLRGGAIQGGIFALLLWGVLWLGRRRQAFLVSLLPLLVVVDLAPMAWANLLFTGPGPARESPAAVRVIRSRTRLSVSPPRLYRSAKLTDTVFPAMQPRSMEDSQRLWLAILTPNLASVFGIATVPGYDAATAGALDAFWAEGIEFGATLLRLLGIEYALLPVRDNAAPDKRGSHYEPLADPLPGSRLYEVKDTLPRGYVAGAAAVHDDKDVLYYLFTPEVADGNLVLVTAGQDYVPKKGPLRRVGHCTVKTHRSSHMKARCTADSPGVAVFTEQYEAGWSATVDERPATVLRVNHVMRGVEVGEGEHTVTFSYRPPGLTAGIALSALGLLGLVCLGAVGGLSRHRVVRKEKAPV